MNRGLNRHLLDRLAVEGVRLVEGDGGQGSDGGQGDGAQGGQDGAQGSADSASGGASGDGPGDTGSGAQGGSGAQTGQQGGAGETDLSQLAPDELARMVRDLRKENGANRTNAKQEAATSAKKELAQEVGKMLGLVDDDTADPDKLKNQLGTAQQKHRETAVELAVHQAASTHGADPSRLLDSRRFINAVHQLDPTSETFSADVGKEIGAAVEQDDQLKAAQAAPRSGGEFTGGSGGGRKRTGNLAAAVRGSMNKE